MNKKIIAGLVLVVVAGGSFFAGMSYAKSGMPARGQFAAGQFMRGAGGAGARGGLSGQGFVAGSIVSKDVSGITVKLQDGSTKIVLLASSTQVMKAAAGTDADLTVGASVVVTGPTNSDGSVSAQSVQVRPTSGQAR